MKFSSLARIIVATIVLAFIGSAIIKFSDQVNISAIRQIVEQVGIFAPMVFIGIYILVIVCSMPAAPLTMAAGLIWGPIWGTIFSLIGAMSGASIAFLIARYIASEWVQQNAGKIGQKILNGIKHNSWKFVAVIRLVPVFPFAITNYAFGVTAISFRSFWFASIIFMAPGAFAYAYLGSLGDDVLQGDFKNIITKILLVIGMFALLACIPWLLKLFNQKELLSDLEEEGKSA
jgi:uncharacterized membrane protein YdjX (TVP38/TMEM64 family)